jgi:quercetin dioxygenase-like cupin family protein/DNA-binding transcriptional MerR regulator
MKPTSSELSFSIGDAASLIGVSPGILRAWEREELIAPDRTEGSHRVYRKEHIGRLKKIARLYFEEKLNPAAIRRELGLAPASPSQQNFVDAELGRRLRGIRKRRQMTLMQTAEKSGLSSSFISALERGNTGVSLDALFRLSEALGTTLPSLRGEELGAARRRFVDAGKRQRFTTDNGLVSLEDMISRPAGMEANMVVFQPGADSGVFYAHRGQEFVHVLEGELSVWLEPNEHHRLKPGDTLYFHSDIKHRWKNESDKPTRAMWVNVALPATAAVEAGSGPQEPEHAGMAVNKH